MFKLQESTQNVSSSPMKHPLKSAQLATNRTKNIRVIVINEMIPLKMKIECQNTYKILDRSDRSNFFLYSVPFFYYTPIILFS